MDSEQCWERTHSWGDEDPDPDWEKAIEKIQAKACKTKPAVSAKVNLGKPKR